MTPNRRSVSETLVSLAALVLVLVGCGADSGDHDNDGGTDKSPGLESNVQQPEDDPEPTAEVPEVDPADQAIAEAAVLTLQDFPPGWESTPTDDDDDRKGRENIATCVGVEYDDLYRDSNANAKSPDFKSEGDDEVSSSVTVDRDEGWMIDAFEIASRPKFRECVVDGIVETVEASVAESGEDVEVGAITINEMSFGSFGDETLAFRMTIPLDVSGFSFEAKGDFVVVRVGRAQTSASSFSLGSGLSTEEFTGYVDLAVQRLTEALAQGE